MTCIEMESSRLGFYTLDPKNKGYIDPSNIRVIKGSTEIEHWGRLNLITSKLRPELTRLLVALTNTQNNSQLLSLPTDKYYYTSKYFDIAEENSNPFNRLTNLNDMVFWIANQINMSNLTMRMLVPGALLVVTHNLSQDYRIIEPRYVFNSNGVFLIDPR